MRAVLVELARSVWDVLKLPVTLLLATSHDDHTVGRSVLDLLSVWSIRAKDCVGIILADYAGGTPRPGRLTLNLPLGPHISARYARVHV